MSLKASVRQSRVALRFRQREGRVFQQFDVTVDQTGLAACALTFLAAMHHRDALAEGRVEDGFALADIHLDPDRLETNQM
jgi:hypothetical protein